MCDTLPDDITGSDSFRRGLELLERPVWPLASLFLMLYLTGPYDTPEALASDMPDTLEASDIEYDVPGDSVRSISDILFPVAMMLRNEPCGRAGEILSERLAELTLPDGSCQDSFDGLLAICRHDIVENELEKINSLLCAPCRCDVCCTGPGSDAAHEFFEIPLRPDEVSLFRAKCIDSAASRRSLSSDEPPLILGENSVPFYHSAEPLLVHWKNGWSLVMPRLARCPNLEGGCLVYQDRPEVCRKPQIFPFVIEKNREGAGCVVRNALLAVWDCPYVRHLKDEIAVYASRNELELFFRKNKE